jgi:phage-related protein
MLNWHEYTETVIVFFMELALLKQSKRELRNAPHDVVSDVFALFEDLMAGKRLSMPISRHLPSIAKGLHGLRLSGSSGECRVFYVIHAAVKKKQELNRKTADLLKLRIRSIGI